jgi:hypothetical protein
MADEKHLAIGQVCTGVHIELQFSFTAQNQRKYFYF